MSFWPSKITLKDISIASLWALISWVIWSLVLVILIFLISNFINIWDTFEASRTWAWTTNMIFPIILSIFTFISTSITAFLTYFFLHLINPEKYRKNNVILGQIAFLTFFVYIFFAIAYIYVGSIDYDYLMIVFLVYSIIILFASSLIIEILNNYRYVLVSIYGSFLGLFITIAIIALIFSSIDSANAKLISLLFLLPLINLSQIFFKWLFDFLYYHYYRITNLDQIWDIFYMIEVEEKEALKEEEEKNSI